MIHDHANEGKVVDAEWHAFRQMARETAMSPEEFDDRDRTRYNLDDDDPVAPARITGANNPETYEGDGEGDLAPLPDYDSGDAPYR
jgi:hypothetical protein